jgi:hypothetical protein
MRFPNEAMLGWFNRAKTKVASNQRPVPSTIQFPQLVEVIPGKLKVKVFLHDVQYENATIPCWTYLTDGLLTHKQKEIMFTLRRDLGRRPEDYPREFFRLFFDFFRLAEQGQLVDVGSSTLFNEEGFYGCKDFRGIGYVEPESFPGVETGDSPLLAGILLKNDGALIAWRLGLTRVVALLGRHFRYYPCPTWSDLSRKPVASLAVMENSLLKNAAQVSVRGSFYQEGNQIFLRLFHASRRSLQEFFAKVGPSDALALRTQVDPRANACLVWPASETNGLEAITPPNSDGSRKTGAFLLFLSEQSSNKIQALEDGVAVFLTNGDWRNVREAFQSGSDIVIPVTGEGGGTFSLEWFKPEAYTSPVTGETFFAESWTTHTPQGISALPKLSASVSAADVVLLSEDRHLKERTTAEDLGGYVKEIENAVDKFFAFPQRKTQRKIAINVALMRDGSTIRFVATPELTAEDSQELLIHLERVRAPKVTGLVKLEYIASLWSFAVRH